MLNSDLADELRNAQNLFCDRVFDNERTESEFATNGIPNDKMNAPRMQIVLQG